jgi:exopolysaccharide biosynthesis polyprenyl glycosylphosphotransferase
MPRAIFMASADILAIVVPAALLMSVHGIAFFGTESMAMAIAAVSWMALASEKRLYRGDQMRSIYSDAGTLWLTTVQGTALTVLILLFTGHFAGGLADLRGLVLISLLTRPAARLTARDIVRAMSTRRSNRILVYGAGEIGQRLAATLIKYHKSDAEVLGFVDDTLWRKGVRSLLGLPVVSDNQLEDMIADCNINHVVVAFSDMKDSRIVSRVRACQGKRGVQVSIIPRFFETDARPANVIEVRDIPLVTLQDRGNLRLQLACKRALDIALGGGAFLCALPIMAAAAAAIRLEGQKQILFRQVRVGKDGEPFTMYKLCSMRELRPGEDPNGASRYTRVGALMRKTSIDELPQLWNIVRGDMSLVGPRPEQQHYVEMCSSRIGRYEERHRMRGGLTGLAQVSGLRGDTSLVERARLDNYYIDHWSFWLDIKIIMRTFVKLIPDSQGVGGEGAFKDIIAEVVEALPAESRAS